MKKQKKYKQALTFTYILLKCNVPNNLEQLGFEVGVRVGIQSRWLHGIKSIGYINMSPHIVHYASRKVQSNMAHLFRSSEEHDERTDDE